MSFLSRVALGHEHSNEIVGQDRTHDPTAEHEDIHVVVFHARVRRVGIVADGGTNTGKLVGGDACTDSATADEHAALGTSVDHGAPTNSAKSG